MKLQKLTIAAFALSMTGAIAAGYSSDDKSKQRQAEAPAGHADQAQQGQSTMQKDTLAANQRGSNGASATGSAATAAQSSAPAGFADKAQPGQPSRQQDTQGQQAASTSGNGSSAAASGNGASASASGDTVRQAQQALQQKGHDPGQIDGVMGPNTKEALKSFQQAQGLQSSGKLDQQTLAALGVQGNGSTQAQASSGRMNTAQAGSAQGTDSKLEGTQGFGDKSQKY